MIKKPKRALKSTNKPHHREGYFTYEQWIEDLLAIPTDQKTLFIYSSLRNKKHLHIFGRYFFPHWIRGNNDVPDCHLDLIEEMAKPKDSGIIFPRGYAKSTWEKIDSIHDMVYGIEEVILYIGATTRDAQAHTNSVKNELESNELLISVYGYQAPHLLPGGEKKASKQRRKWTEGQFENSRGSIMVARGRAKGRGVNIKGRRPTKVIIDDVEDDEQVANPKLRRKLHDWLYYVIFPSMDRDKGRIKMIGTVLHTEAEVLAFYETHGGIFRMAIEDGKSIWPDFYSLEQLDEIRAKIGLRAFNREYLNNPLPDNEAGIKREWLEDAYFSELPKSHYRGFGNIDPQAGETGAADEYAITILYTMNRTPHQYVVEQVAGRASQLEQAKQVVRAWLRHKDVIVNFGVEKVLNQTAVWQYLIQWKSRQIDFNSKDLSKEHREWIDEDDRNIPIIAVAPTKNKKARLEVFEACFERKEIHLKREMEELQRQIMFLGTDTIDHDDRVDSLVGALELSGKSGSTKRVSEVYRPKAMAEGDKTKYNKTIAGNLMTKKY